MTPAHAGVTLKMVIPRASQTSARRREYVSQAIASVVYEITQGTATTSLVTGSDYTNVTLTGSNPTCTSGSTGYVCSIVIPAAITSSGTYNVTIASYDQAQSSSCVPGGAPACAGNLLGSATLPETLTPGSTTPVAVTLGGVPAYVQPLSLTSYAGGVGDFDKNRGIVVFGPQAQVGEIELEDADGNVIINPGAPVITASSQNPSALTVSVATPDPSGVYAITFSPVKSGNYVQANTYPVTLTIAIPNTSTSYQFEADVQVAHSGTFVSECVYPDTGTVYGYLDGNQNLASPDMTIAGLTCTSSGAPAVATDGYGNLYVATYASVAAYAVAPGSPAPFASTGPAQDISQPNAVAADRDGFLYVGDSVSGLVVLPQPSPGSSSFGTPAADLPAADFLGYAPSTLAADTAGNLYVGADIDGSLGIYRLPSANNGLTSSTVPTSLINLIPGPLYYYGGSLAVGAQPAPTTAPDFWVADENNSDTGTLLEYAPSGTSPVTTSTNAAFGNTAPQIAIDNAGNVYVAAMQDSIAQLVTLSPPSYTPGTPSMLPSPAPFALGVAVAPAAGVLGNNTGGGSPAPLSTASPAAARIRRP